MVPKVVQREGILAPPSNTFFFLNVLNDPNSLFGFDALTHGLNMVLNDPLTCVERIVVGVVLDGVLMRPFQEFPTPTGGVFGSALDAALPLNAAIRAEFPPPFRTGATFPLLFAGKALIHRTPVVGVTNFSVLWYWHVIHPCEWIPRSAASRRTVRDL